MMNQVSLMGRLVADPEVQTFQRDGKENAMAQFRLAVERDYKKDNVRPVDYLSCKAFGSQARFAGTYLHKGDTIVVTGRVVAERYKKSDEEKESIFTCVQVREIYPAKHKSEDGSRSRSMDPVQDGKKRTEAKEEPEEEYGNLPPLPEDEMFDQMQDEADLSFG